MNWSILSINDRGANAGGNESTDSMSGFDIFVLRDSRVFWGSLCTAGTACEVFRGSTRILPVLAVVWADTGSTSSILGLCTANTSSTANFFAVKTHCEYSHS